jgi:NAD(P)-dependent dehydrogenase (short-subunit alcohol dehydrogenase family)
MTMIEILIVGASGGLGTAIARAFAAGGASLALVGHSRQQWVAGRCG